MDLKDRELSKLFELSKSLKEEFEIFVFSFVFWEQLFQEKNDESNTHAIIRTLFFREIVLGITRIWDNTSRNKSSLSMFRLANCMADKRIIDFLSQKGTKELKFLLEGINTFEIDSSNLADTSQQNSAEYVREKAKKIKEIVDLYAGEKKHELDKLKHIRNNIIAHRNIRFQENPDNVIKIIDDIYKHTSSIIDNLIDVLGCEKWDIRKIEDLYRRQSFNLKF